MKNRRSTVYLDAELHRALRLKAAATDSSISNLVSEAARLYLSEDAEDLSTFEARKRERSVDFETFVMSLKRRGKL